jgi:filamentous hemagglutinin
VKPGDTGTYGELKAQKAEHGETEPLDMDHQPSFASQKAAAEKSLGRPLTPEEARALKDSTPAVASPREVHQQTSPTYGGRNNPTQIDKDASDLGAAAARDKAAFDKAMEDRKK